MILMMISFLALFFSSDNAIAYTCPAGYQCSQTGGSVPYWIWVQKQNSELAECSTVRHATWDCSGTSDNCSGESPSVSGKFSSANCHADQVYGDVHWYCCVYTGCDSTCETCTPSCGTGYSSSPTGCPAVSFSCGNPDNDCGRSCPDSKESCYLIETNTKFIQDNGSESGPTSISMIVDGQTFQLSTNPDTPTRIKLPASGSSDVQISVPTFTGPSTSSGWGYQFMADNYGNDNEWGTDWVSCSGTDGEDFCTEVPNTNNTQSFVPTSKTVNQVLKEGAIGKISGIYTTTDKCTATYKYSPAIEGYYVVDYRPDPPEPCIPGDPTCTPPPIFRDIGATTTAKGCKTLTYSGAEANNELHVIADVTDTNSLDEIQAFTLWFSKDSNVPAIGTVTASYTGSVNSDVGIMIKKRGASWDNPRIYTTNSSLTWGLITISHGVGYINISGTNIIEISDISVIQDTTDITFDYKIRFLNTSENLSGMYNVYGGGLDTLMINGNLLDQSYFVKFFNWGVDLVNPTVGEITQEIIDPKNTYITWNNADETSGIRRTVINAYRLGGLSTDPEGVKLFLPSAYTTLLGAITLDPNIPIPSDREIGLYNDTNAWKFNSNTGEKDKVNVGNNESGKIALYITAYDKACNTNGTSGEIDLNPWFATRGATLYSRGNISTSAKPVAGLEYLDGVFNPKTGMNSNLIDLGTELLSTRNAAISTLMHSNSGAAMATNIEDSNNTKAVWYTKLLNKLDKFKAGLTVLNSVGDSCTTTGCYMYSPNDITIPQGYTCSNPTLFISEKDIHLSPNILSDNAMLSGCIFLAKNNIYVDAGTFKSSSGTKVQYDYIEGYLIADNQIIFPIADETQSLRDGVEIFGGMVALGTNVGSGESAVSIRRNLRLYSQINPTVVLTYDNKYSAISTMFFGTEYNLYKQEVGFKTF